MTKFKTIETAEAMNKFPGAIDTKVMLDIHYRLADNGELVVVLDGPMAGRLALRNNEGAYYDWYIWNGDSWDLADSEPKPRRSYY